MLKNLLKQNLPKKTFWLLVLAAAVFGGLLSLFMSQRYQVNPIDSSDLINKPYYFPDEINFPNLPSSRSSNNKSTLCFPVITPARNPFTGEVKDFPSPCDVPEGWQILESLLE